MGESAKLKTCCFKLNPKILKDWKDTISHNEKIKERLESLMVEDSKKRNGEKR